MSGSISSEELLRAYDEQLRTRAEMANALTTHRIGPLWLATYAGGHGFITYQDLLDVAPGDLDHLIADALAHFASDTAVTTIEWKTRGHDVAPDLHERLLAHGFAPEEPESIMLGAAAALALDVPLPVGVTVRQVRDESEIRAMCAMQDHVFGGTTSDDRVDELIRRHASDDYLQLWIAEADGEIVSAGRLELVPETSFAGLWGGSTLPDWRGKGIYRALTAARARAAPERGRLYLHSDSTEFSRPILERSGMIKVSTTTPYLWER